jgi:hypothetical protein
MSNETCPDSGTGIDEQTEAQGQGHCQHLDETMGSYALTLPISVR